MRLLIKVAFHLWWDGFDGWNFYYHFSLFRTVRSYIVTNANCSKRFQWKFSSDFWNCMANRWWLCFKWLWPDWKKFLDYRFSAFRLRSKCSICSYQLNLWYVSYWIHWDCWFLDSGRLVELAPLRPRVGPVSHCLRDRPFPLRGVIYTSVLICWPYGWSDF